jgi:hypothetical protein
MANPPEGFSTLHRVPQQVAGRGRPAAIFLSAMHCRCGLTFISFSGLLFAMRILLNITFPHDKFNAAVKDGSAGKKLKKILDKMKPEAVYFTGHHGKRGAIMVVDLPDASKIPSLAEPWFLSFNADVDFQIAMTPGDLAKADLDKLGKKWA